MLWKCKLNNMIIEKTEMSGNQAKSQHNSAKKKNQVKQIAKFKQMYP